MAMSDRAKKSNLCYLIQHGGTQVCRALLNKRIKDLKPQDEDPEAWTVDSFLLMKKPILERKLKTKRAYMSVLFPPGQTTNLQSWDVSLLCYILRETCGLNDTLNIYVDHIRMLRNEIAHLNDSEIDDNEYSHIIADMKICFQMLMTEIGDDELNKTINDSFTTVENGLIPNDELLKVEQTMLRAIEDMRNEQRNQHEETRRVVEKGNQELAKFLQQILHLLLMQSQITTNQPVKYQVHVETPIPEVSVKVQMHNCSPDVENTASNEIVKSFGQQIQDDSDQPNVNKMDNAVHKVREDFETRGCTIMQAATGCIVLRVKCSSILSLLVLLRDYVTGSLDASLKELEEAARSLNGCQDLRIETVIYEDEVYRIMSDIDFRQFLRSDKSETVEIEKGSDSPAEANSLRNVSKEDRESDDFRQFLRSNQSETVEIEKGSDSPAEANSLRNVSKKDRESDELKEDLMAYFKDIKSRDLDKKKAVSLETLVVDNESEWAASCNNLAKSARTLKYLSLQVDGKQMFLTDENITALTGLTCLQTLYLNNVHMTHSNRKCLDDYIGQTTTLTQLKLKRIDCLTHKHEKCYVALDLHHLNKLKMLDLDYVGYRELRVNPASLDTLVFWSRGWNMRVLGSATLWQNLRAAPVLSSLTLWRIKSCPEMIQTLHTLTELRYLELGGIEMGDLMPCFSAAMTKLERVELPEMEMSYQAWKKLFLSVGQLQQSITVKLSWSKLTAQEWSELMITVGQLPNPVTVKFKDCHGPSAEEWKTVEEVIKATPTLTLLKDFSIKKIYLGDGASLTLKNKQQ